MGLGQVNQRRPESAEAGYAMAALLVGLSVMAVLMTMAMPVWTTFNKREREAELIWRGEQYARAIGLFQRKYANTYPPNVDVLVEQKFLRRKYKDPITNEDFQMIPAGAGGNQPGGPQTPSKQGTGSQLQMPNPEVSASPTPGGGSTTSQPGQTGTQPSIGIQGVVSKSNAKSLKVYNGRTKYNEWTFVHVASTQRPGQAGGVGQERPGDSQDPRNPFKNLSPGARPPVNDPGSSPFGPMGPSGQPPPGSKPVFGMPSPPKGQQ